MVIRHAATGWPVVLMMLLGLLFAAPKASAQTAGWSVHPLDAARISVPADWIVKRVNNGKEIDITSPDGSRRLLVWWWFPDEPLLGYPDIVSHRKVTVAGERALYIHSRTGSRDTISVTLDKGRKDKRRLHFLYEIEGDLSQGDPALDDILSRVTLGGDPAPDNRRSEASPPVPTSVPTPVPTPLAAQPAPAPGAGRVWLGQFSIEPPAGWTAASDRDARIITLARPDGGARIDMWLLADGEPMPSEGLEEIDHTLAADRPATRLTLRSADTQAVYYIFDEPDADGARPSLALTTRGEIAGDLPVFERVAESLRADLPPGVDTARVVPVGPAGNAGAGQPAQNTQGGAVSDEELDQDPFAGLDLD